LPLALGGCLLYRSSSDGGGSSGELLIRTAEGDVTLSVEIADTLDERTKGLMDRESHPADSGMAFLWSEPTAHTFSMENTLIPLSIAFWDERGRIVRIFDMDPCEVDSCPSYAVSEPSVGAVEVNQGWFAEHGVEVGDLVELSVVNG
jgi:uncharacterized membrane protein (UPF0127 family)